MPPACVDGLLQERAAQDAVYFTDFAFSAAVVVDGLDVNVSVNVKIVQFAC